MADPFLGEIRIFGFPYAPRDWALCHGQLLAISQNQPLFALLSTTYGGNTTSFNLPDLQGRLPMGQGQGPGLSPRQIGEKYGAEATTEVPAHTHTLAASTAATGLTQAPAANWTLGAAGSGGGRTPTPVEMYGTAAGTVESAPTSSAGVPGVSLMNPFLVLNFCIALQGLFPPRN